MCVCVCVRAREATICTGNSLVLCLREKKRVGHLLNRPRMSVARESSINPFPFANKIVFGNRPL